MGNTTGVPVDPYKPSEIRAIISIGQKANILYKEQGPYYGVTVCGDMTLSVVDGDEPLDQLIKGDEKKIIFYQKTLSSREYPVESGPASAADVFDKPCIKIKQPFLHIKASKQEIATIKKHKIAVLDGYAREIVKIKRFDGGEEKEKEKEKEKETKKSYEEMGDSLDKEEGKKYLKFKNSKFFYVYINSEGIVRGANSI